MPADPSGATMLTRDVLPSLAGKARIPGYLDRELRIGVVHFGVGNFHRSHQAMYLDRLLEAGAHDDWAICGIGLMPRDTRMRDVLGAQDGLYTLTLRHPDGSDEIDVIGSLRRFLYAPDDPQAVIDQLCDPGVRIVSLTITEGGYVHDPVGGKAASDDPAVAEETSGGLSAPITAFGYIAAALRARRAAGIAPFTVLSCDNIQGNGDVARLSVVEVARLTDPELAAWIDDTVAFPNTMVDRITPATEPTDEQRIVDRLGVVDRWPVASEPFTQWIIEDRFPSGRPAFEAVGATLAHEIDAYESVKLRLLNGPHQVLAYIGQLAGYHHVHEAMRDEGIVGFLRRYMRDDAIPSFDPPADVDVDEYCVTVLERFGNPSVLDTLARLSNDGSDRIPVFALPVLRDRLAAGAVPVMGAALLASWAGYWSAADEGALTPSPDPRTAELLASGRAWRDDPASFLTTVESLREFTGHPAFSDAFLEYSRALRDQGPQAFLGLVQS
jgi:mannitol 2-dehydrogenase